MREWRQVHLGQIADVRVSNVDKKTLRGEKPVQLCNYMDVYSNDYIRGDLTFMSASATCAEIARFKVECGDVLITKDSETPDDIGIPAVVIDEIDNLVCGYHVALIKPNKSFVDPVYLSKQLGRAETAAYFARYAAGSTRYGLPMGAMTRTPIALAPLAQQKKIAAILSSIDIAIEQTEALIGKYRHIKAGLMHDLFTRGVLPNGQLRPPREQAPELYQETAIGWIPKDWGCCTLNEKVNVARPIVYGILMPGYGYPGGVPVVKVKDIRNRAIEIDGLLLTSPAIDREYRRSRLKAGDVLFTIRGTVGRVAMVPPQLENANITQDTARIDLVGVDNNFASLYLETDSAIRFFEINTLGVAVQGINLGELRKLPIPVPDTEEQERISKRINSVLKQIEIETENRNKLEQKKRGLMQDLLTGKVPVRVDAETPELADA